MKPARTPTWRLIAALTAGFAPWAWAQDGSVMRSLAAACFTCHGYEGRSVDGVPPAIAGLDRNYLLQTLKDFKSGKRSATIMHQQAKGYTDQELEALAAYFSGRASGAANAPPRAPALRY